MAGAYFDAKFLVLPKSPLSVLHKLGCLGWAAWLLSRSDLPICLLASVVP